MTLKIRQNFHLLCSLGVMAEQRCLQHFVLLQITSHVISLLSQQNHSIYAFPS